MSTYRNEWPCCGSVTETEAWEPEHCPFCTDDAPSTPQAAMSAELPPLPDPMVTVNRYGLGCSTSDGDGGVFTADQLRAYARSALAAQAAEVQALRADAERYRWLRDVSVPPHNFYLSVPVEFDGVRFTTQDVDAAIDAARAALKEQT